MKKKQPVKKSHLQNASNKLLSKIELRQKNKQIINILEGINDAFISFDNNYNYVYVNSKAEKLLGKKRRELIGMHIQKLFPTSINHIVYEKMQEAIKKRKSQQFNFYAEKSNKWYETKIFPFPQGVSIYFSDVTKQKEAEEKLKFNEIRFRELLENSSDGFRLINKEGEILYASPSTKKILGYSSKEYLHKNIFSFIHPDDRLGYEKILNKVLHTPKKPISFIYRIKHKNGTWRWLEGVGTNLLNDPDINGVISNFRDITERIVAEEKLKQSEALYRKVVENVNDLIAIIDEQAIFLYASPSHKLVLGYSQKSLTGKSGALLVHPDDLEMVKKSLAKVLSTGKANATFRFKKRNGEWITIDSVGSLILDTSGKKMVIMASHDVTQRADLEKRKDEFISMASHELKTPVTSIKLFLEVLQKQTKKYNDEKADKLIIRIKDQTNRLQELISELLDISRIQTGKLFLRKEEFALDELIDDAVEGLRGTTTRHKIIFKKPPKVIINGDKFRIYQIITNLIINAIKYSPESDKIIVILQKNKTSALCSVRDFGIGIDKNYQEKIFDKLFQIPGVDETTFPGLGMGLFISKDIVERHGGKIWVKSKKGKETTFFFSLPLNINSNS